VSVISNPALEILAAIFLHIASHAPVNPADLVLKLGMLVPKDCVEIGYNLRLHEGAFNTARGTPHSTEINPNPDGVGSRKQNIFGRYFIPPSPAPPTAAAAQGAGNHDDQKQSECRKTFSEDDKREDCTEAQPQVDLLR
jgi:hypothetical protein